MDFSIPEELQEIRAAVRELCAGFPDAYWRELEPRPVSHGVRARRSRDGGWLSAPHPRGVRRCRARHHRGEHHPRGDQRLGRQRGRLSRADVHRWARCCGTAPRSRSASYLPQIATGELRLQAFGVTEPNAGSDTTQIQTTRRRATATATSSAARRSGSRGREHSDLMLLARAHDAVDRGEEARPTGCRSFLVDLRGGRAAGSTIRPIRHDDEPRDDRALLRRPRGAGRARSSARRARASATSSTA